MLLQVSLEAGGSLGMQIHIRSDSTWDPTIWGMRRRQGGRQAPGQLTPELKLRSDATRYTAPHTHPWLVTRGIACTGCMT